MALVRFTSTLARHRPAPVLAADGQDLRAVLAGAFAADPLLENYILDEQGRVRKHINIFVDGALIADRQTLSDPVGPNSEIYILQALSGG